MLYKNLKTIWNVDRVTATTLISLFASRALEKMQISRSRRKVSPVSFIIPRDPRAARLNASKTTEDFREGAKEICELLQNFDPPNCAVAPGHVLGEKTAS